MRQRASHGAGLRHVPTDALDFTLIAAAQLNDVTVGVADEDRHLSVLAESDRPLGDSNIVRLASHLVRTSGRPGLGIASCSSAIAGALGSQCLQLTFRRAPTSQWPPFPSS